MAMMTGAAVELTSVTVQVRVRRIQLFPLFEDYDRVHIGSVTKGQVCIIASHCCVWVFLTNT